MNEIEKISVKFVWKIFKYLLRQFWSQKFLKIDPNIFQKMVLFIKYQ